MQTKVWASVAIWLNCSTHVIHNHTHTHTQTFMHAYIYKVHSPIHHHPLLGHRLNCGINSYKSFRLSYGSHGAIFNPIIYMTSWKLRRKIICFQLIEFILTMQVCGRVQAMLIIIVKWPARKPLFYSNLQHKYRIMLIWRHNSAATSHPMKAQSMTYFLLISLFPLLKHSLSTPPPPPPCPFRFSLVKGLIDNFHFHIIYFDGGENIYAVKCIWWIK